MFVTKKSKIRKIPKKHENRKKKSRLRRKKRKIIKRYNNNCGILNVFFLHLISRISYCNAGFFLGGCNAPQYYWRSNIRAVLSSGGGRPRGLWYLPGLKKINDFIDFKINCWIDLFFKNQLLD